VVDSPKQKRRHRRKAARDDHKVSRYTASERQVQRAKRLADAKRARRDYLADRHAVDDSDGA
jgi:hypothetical protein